MPGQHETETPLGDETPDDDYYSSTLGCYRWTARKRRDGLGRRSFYQFSKENRWLKDAAKEQQPKRFSCLKRMRLHTYIKHLKCPGCVKGSPLLAAFRKWRRTIRFLLAISGGRQFYLFISTMPFSNAQVPQSSESQDWRIYLYHSNCVREKAGSKFVRMQTNAPWML